MFPMLFPGLMSFKLSSFGDIVWGLHSPCDDVCVKKYFIFLNNELIEENASPNKSLNNVLQEAVSPIEEEKSCKPI